jgi:hypothetical protein
MSRKAPATLGILATIAATVISAILLFLPERTATYSCPRMPVVDAISPRPVMDPPPDYFDVNRRCDSDGRARSIAAGAVALLPIGGGGVVFARRRRATSSG